MPGCGRKSHFPADQERMELPQCHLFGLTWGISFLGRAEVLLDLLLLLKNESVRKKNLQKQQSHEENVNISLHHHNKQELGSAG